MLLTDRSLLLIEKLGVPSLITCRSIQPNGCVHFLLLALFLTWPFEAVEIKLSAYPTPTVSLAYSRVLVGSFCVSSDYLEPVLRHASFSI